MVNRSSGFRPRRPKEKESEERFAVKRVPIMSWHHATRESLSPSTNALQPALHQLPYSNRDLLPDAALELPRASSARTTRPRPAAGLSLRQRPHAFRRIPRYRCLVWRRDGRTDPFVASALRESCTRSPNRVLSLLSSFSILLIVFTSKTTVYSSHGTGARGIAHRHDSEQTRLPRIFPVCSNRPIDFCVALPQSSLDTEWPVRLSPIGLPLTRRPERQ